ncbi:pro-opiomelanocortin isoform X1 [Hemicordylus capensis]|nr:pro-opiomelanocortin isoform X1 [Hemicordylus capensis]
MLTPQWGSLWVILGVLLFHSVGGILRHCQESGWCRDMDTEAEVMECIKACRAALSQESPVNPGESHLQPLSKNVRKYVMSHFRWNRFGKSNSSDLGPKREDLPRGSSREIAPASSEAQDVWEGDRGYLERQEGKRSYAMEHFRWGKPVGRKRRPIKVYPNGVEEESAESDPQEVRRDLAWEWDYPEYEIPEEKKNSEAAMFEEEAEEPPEEAKKDGTAYKMRHFRWNAPPKDKRYGGFMTSEQSHTPLVTLFRNAIIKSAYKKGQ